MEILFNGDLYQPGALNFDTMDRAFKFGDGLFETIMVKEGKARHLNLHLERLHLGMKTLSLEFSQEVTEIKLAASIKTLTMRNGFSDHARVRLQVWRKSGGLYTPHNNKVNTLISASLPIQRSPIVKKAAIAHNIHLHFSTLSSLKTCNALPYVLAGVEKQARGLDEIILLDNHGNLSECSSSNLFWIKNEVLYTPALTTGCVSGVMRKNILQQASLWGRKTKEVEEKPEMLYAANQVFCSNVTGLYFFEEIEHIRYQTTPDPEIANMIRVLAH